VVPGKPGDAPFFFSVCMANECLMLPVRFDVLWYQHTDISDLEWKQICTDGYTGEATGNP